MDCSTPGFPVFHHLPEFAQTHAHWDDDIIQLFHPLRPPLPLPSIFPNIRDFSNESAVRIRWPRYWSFSFSISPSNEYSGLISLRIDWFDLLAVQRTLKSLLQHHSSKASISLSWLKFMFTESVMLSDHLIVHCPFSFCLQSSPASGSFPVSWLFASRGQRIRVSVSVLPVNIQCWFPLGLAGLISLQSKGLSRVFSSTTVQKHQCFSIQLSLWANSYICTWLMEKP